MSFLRHRQRLISAVTRGRWIIPSRRTWNPAIPLNVLVTEDGLALVTEDGLYLTTGA